MSENERNGETPDNAPTNEPQTAAPDVTGENLPQAGYEAAAAEAATSSTEGEAGGPAAGSPEAVPEQAAEAAPEQAAEAAPEQAAEAAPEQAAEAAPEQDAEAAPEQAEGAEGAEGPKGVKVRRKKSLYAAEVKSGQDVDGVFLVHRKTLPVDRTGRAFLAVTLIDRSGRLEARLWDDAEKVTETFREGDFVRIKGQGQSFQGRMQVRLESIEAVHPSTLEVPTSEFMPETKKPSDRMFGEVVALVEGLENEHLRRLARELLEDPELSRKFRRAPAAQSVHHAWIGGLLEHTLSVMKLAQRLCDHYPQVNRDLVLAGALLHDFGKIEELSYEAGVSYSDTGRLVGHLVMMSQWIYDRARRMEGFPEPLLDHLVHIVVSHHGQYEYGSPRRPKTLEALLVHYADVIDARMSSWTDLLEDVGPDGWTDYNRIYDRHLFRTDLTQDRSAPRKKKKRRKKRKPEGAVAGAPAERRADRPAAGGERPAAGERAARGERPPRGDRPARGERPPRGDRPARGERPPRGDRPRRAEGEGERRPRGAEGGRKREGKPETPATLTFNPFASALKKPEPEEKPPVTAPEQAPEKTPEQAPARSEGNGGETPPREGDE